MNDLKSRMIVEAQTRPAGSFDQVQVDLWRILQGAEDVGLTHMSVPMAKLRVALEYIAKLEAEFTKVVNKL
jgi:hypothetical protein